MKKTKEELVTDCTLKRIGSMLSAYHSYRSQQKAAGERGRLVKKKLFLTADTEKRLQIVAQKLKTTTDELVNAILWDYLLRTPKTAS